MLATQSISKLLEQWNDGDRGALDKLMPLIYDELRKMAKRYMSRVVELRYFGGLTVAETARVLEVSQETVMRDLAMAKSWLHRALKAA
jgi:ECF sigma factor